MQRATCGGYRLSSLLFGLHQLSLRSRYVVDIIGFKAGQLINDSHKQGEPASKPVRLRIGRNKYTNDINSLIELKMTK